MLDKGFDTPRQPGNIGKPPTPESTPPIQKKYKIKPGSMVVVRRTNGENEDGWMAHVPQGERIIVSKIGADGVEDTRGMSVEALTDLNRHIDPFRTGAWGISVRRSDGTIEGNWTSRGQIKPGFYELERSDDKVGKLIKVVRIEDLQELNL
jgi:hypothetical protein